MLDQSCLAGIFDSLSLMVDCYISPENIFFLCKFLVGISSSLVVGLTITIPPIPEELPVITPDNSPDPANPTPVPNPVPVPVPPQPGVVTP